MITRNFKAKDMKQAMRDIGRELGSDAVILSNTRVEDGVEVMATLEYDADIFKKQFANPNDKYNYNNLSATNTDSKVNKILHNPQVKQVFNKIKVPKIFTEQKLKTDEPAYFLIMDDGGIFNFSLTFNDHPEINNQLVEKSEKAGMKVSGRSKDGKLVEIIELPKNGWFVGCQFHPEFKSRPNRPHPLFREFIKAAIEKSVSSIA